MFMSGCVVYGIYTFVELLHLSTPNVLAGVQTGYWEKGQSVVK